MQHMQHWVIHVKAVSPRWKPIGIMTAVVSQQILFRGNPYVILSLSFHTWKQSTRGFHLDSLHQKLGGNLTSGFHEFPHLETINPRIPPRDRFLELETSENLTGGFHNTNPSDKKSVASCYHYYALSFIRVPINGTVW